MNFSEQYPELAEAAKKKYQNPKKKQKKVNPFYSETNFWNKYRNMSIGNIPKPKI